MKKDFKNSKAVSFFKKYAYYIVMVLCIIAIGTMVTLAVVLNQPVTSTPGGDVLDKPSGNIPNEPDVPGGNETPDPGEDVDNPSVMVFILPMANAQAVRRYSATDAIYNPTMNVYQVHEAIDYKAAEGTKVVAVYDGVIESIVEDKLTGTVVTILHKDNIRSIYGSVSNVTAKVGQTITKGTAFADPSTSMSTEAEDGAHLHFSMSVNGEVTDPAAFFADGDK